MIRHHSKHPMQDKPDVAAATRKSGFRDLIGYRTTDWRDGYAEVTLCLGPEHMNAKNTPHGGAIAALLDSALSQAVAWCSQPGHTRRTFTVSLTVTYLSVASGDVLITRAKLEAVDGQLATSTGEVRDASGKLVAVAQGSFIYSPGSESVAGVPV